MSQHIRSILRWQQYLLLFEEVPPAPNQQSSGQTRLTLLDFSEPTSPKKRGELLLDFSFFPAYSFYSGSQARAKEGDWLLTPQGLAGLLHNPANNPSASLFFIDLRQPDRPRYRLLHQRTTKEKTSLQPADGATFLWTYTSQREDGPLRHEAEIWTWREERWQNLAPPPAKRLPLPGRLLGAVRSQQDRLKLLHALGKNPEELWGLSLTEWDGSSKGPLLLDLRRMARRSALEALADPPFDHPLAEAEVVTALALFALFIGQGLAFLVFDQAAPCIQRTASSQEKR